VRAGLVPVGFATFGWCLTSAAGWETPPDGPTVQGERAQSRVDDLFLADGAADWSAPARSHIPHASGQSNEMHLSELKAKSPAELLAFAEEVGVENASVLRKQDMMFAILSTWSARSARARAG
jgi:hypothetical protein